MMNVTTPPALIATATATNLIGKFLSYLSADSIPSIASAFFSFILLSAKYIPKAVKKANLRLKSKQDQIDQARIEARKRQAREWLDAILEDSELRDRVRETVNEATIGEDSDAELPPPRASRA